VTLGVAAAVAGCAHRDAATAQRAPAASPAPPAPGAVAPVAPVVPVAEPSAAAPPAERVSSRVAASPLAAGPGPHILALSASPAVVHAGESIALNVRTSTDVATVTGTVSAYTLPFKETSPGRFLLAFAIPPNVPGFFHGTYAMNVTARAVDGSSATRSVSITFQ